MTGAYTICKAREADMTEIIRLQQIAYQSEAILYNDYSIQPLTQTIEQATAEYRGCVVLKAVMDGKIIGSVRAYEKDGDAYIGKLIVLPDYQNRGIGKSLLRAIENEFEGKRFELYTGARSEKNLALYEKCGYVRFKTEQATPDLTFVYMEKTPAKNNYISEIQPITPETRQAVTDFCFMDLQILDGEYQLIKLPPNQPIPAVVLVQDFYSVTKTPDELSIIVSETVTIESGHKETGWSIIKFVNNMDLSLVGVTARIAAALAGSNVNICALATYCTDYIMVKRERLDDAVKALESAGYHIKYERSGS